MIIATIRKTLITSHFIDMETEVWRTLCSNMNHSLKFLCYPQNTKVWQLVAGPLPLHVIGAEGGGKECPVT